jgi:hypothetical protein
MSINPREPISPIAGVDNYTIPGKLVIDKAALGPLPSQMSGENIEETPILPADANRVEDTYTEETRGETPQTYREPGMPYAGSVKSTIWQSRYGGAYIEVAGKKDEPEFINIVHTSGTHITLDPSGSIIIKSFGDTHNITRGNMYESTKGEKVQINSGGYTIHVKDGTLDIRSEGNLNISSGADMNISAAGKLTMNIGDAMDVAAARIALTARVDSLDLVSNTKTRITAASEMSLRSEASMRFLTNSAMDIKAASSITNQTGGAYNVRSSEATNIQAGGQINLKAGGNVNADGSNVFLNSGRAGNAPNANDAEVAIKAGVAAELKKSVFSDNTVSTSAASAGGASKADDPGE